MARGSLPDRRPEGDDLSEQFLGQLGGEEILQEPLVAVDPARPRRVAGAELAKLYELVARPAVLFPGPTRDADGSEQFFAAELLKSRLSVDSRHEPSLSDQACGTVGPR